MDEILTIDQIVAIADEHEYVDPESGNTCFDRLGFARKVIAAAQLAAPVAQEPELTDAMRKRGAEAIRTYVQGVDAEAIATIVWTVMRRASQPAQGARKPDFRCFPGGTYRIDKSAQGERQPECQHNNRKPMCDRIICTDCGAVYPDKSWGVAAYRWFRNETEAQFYKLNYVKLPTITSMERIHQNDQ